MYRTPFPQAVFCKNRIQWMQSITPGFSSKPRLFQRRRKISSPNRSEYTKVSLSAYNYTLVSFEIYSEKYTIFS